MSEAEYYHVRITTKSDRRHNEIKLDLSKEQLTEKFLNPYEYGTNIIVNGKSIEPDDIERIKINRTDVDSSRLLPQIRAEIRSSRVILPISNEWYVTDKGVDITDELILGPSGYKKSEHASGNNGMEVVGMIPENDKIFIVHGHDEEMKQTVARTLEKLDLEPIILHEQPNRGRTIIEKFEASSEKISFAIVLLSPDDKGCKANNFPDSVKLRARQNVILELGYFIGKLGRTKVLVLFKDEIDFEHPSDFVGALYTPFNKGWELEMVKELQSCGYDVDANRLI
ncbi:MAG: nucleotide-binding protein [Methanosarcinales archaeon]|nr:nucleotide-binding protein [Methanosarcinales archaeon]